MTAQRNCRICVAISVLIIILCACRPAEHSDASPPFQWSVGWKWPYSHESLTNGNSEWIPAASSAAISYAPLQDGSTPWYGSSWWTTDGSIYPTRAAIPPRYVSQLCERLKILFLQCSEFDMNEGNAMLMMRECS